jgi:nucleotide sugar dehydrogenase
MNKIGIIGIGRLGLCFALNLEKSGFQVWGIDSNKKYVEQLLNKTFQSSEPEVESYLSNATHFYASTHTNVLFQEGCEYIFLLVPTPSQEDGSFSHQFIDDVVTNLIENTPNDGKTRHLIIGSTVMPGYCDQLVDRVKPFGYTISYNPEFIAQGSIMRDQQFPDQILIGEGHEVATQFLKEMYQKMCISTPEVHVMNLKSAELCKLATNCFLTMKISFANAIGDIASATGGEPEKILKAIGSDSRVGAKYLNYGFGFGGPCFPRDNQALIQFAAQKDFPLHLSEATIKVNQEHLAYQLHQFLEQENEVYTFDYVTYKKDTDIIEKSQQLALAVSLVEKGKKVVLKNSSHIKEKLEHLYPNYFTFES